MILSTEQRSRLLRTFDDFVATWLETPDGRAGLALYERSVREGKRNYREVLASLDRGDDITEEVLLRLLPYANTRANLKRGGWIHLTPGVQGDLRREYERRGWIRKKEWSSVARDIFRFIHNALDDPSNLAAHCDAFSSIPYIKGMQSGMLTPILEAVRPKRYGVINPRLVKVLTHVLGEKFTTNIAHYPKVNETSVALIKEIGSDLTERSGVKRFSPIRLFNLFSWWAIERSALKGKPLSKTPSKATLESPKRVKEPDAVYRVDGGKEKPLSLSECAAALHVSEKKVKSWLDALTLKRQIILFGPPGTGKTYIAEHLARLITSKTKGLTEIVQFHPSYSYEDFMQGIRPQRLDDGGLDYPVVEGRFVRFCREARMRNGADCVMVIDEINRADLSKVFGELMYLLEYRERAVPLASDGRQFSIPSNVYMIGTMNTADRSIALVDHALRRRFAFIEISPDYDILRQFYADGKGTADGVDLEKLVDELVAINNTIDDRHYQLGISFFLVDDLQSRLQMIWEMEIEPYLDEFFFDDRGKVEEFRWKKVEKRVIT